jgi:hypothetical protein
MTVSQQSQQKTIYQVLLPDHNVTNLLPERWNPLAQFSYFLRNFLRRFHTVCSDSLAARMFDQNLAHAAGDRLSVRCQKHAKSDSQMSAFKSWHLATLLVVLAGLALALLAWVARTDPAINCLPRHE